MGAYGARPPSHTAYFVAMGGVLLLLVMLLTYCLCFCLRRIKELASQPLPEPVKSVRPPPPPPPAYPVQPEVRASATAMARLCTLPAARAAAVHPALSPDKARMMPTPPRSPRRTHAHATSPSRTHAHATSPSRTHAHATSPSRTHVYATSPSRTHAHATSPCRPPPCRSPGSRGAPLPPPKVLSRAAARSRPRSMPDAPAPAISISEVK